MEIKNELKTGDQIDVQVSTFGEIPNQTLDGEDVIQKLTPEALQKCVEAWKAAGSKPIRVDLDHNSEITDNTEAAGWLEDLWVAEDGMYGKMTVSDLGVEKLNGLNYRYGSPTFILDEEGYPVEFTSFALTNRPRLKDLKPVYNSASVDGSVVLNADEPETEERTEETCVNNEQMEITKLIQLLGLPETATEEEITVAIQAMVDKLAELAKEEAEKEAAEAEKKLEEEADEILDGCDLDEETKEKVVDSYKKNPEVGKTLICAFKPRISKAVVNFDSAKKPDVVDVTDFQKKLDSLPGGEERVKFLMNFKLNK